MEIKGVFDLLSNGKYIASVSFDEVANVGNDYDFRDDWDLTKAVMSLREKEVEACDDDAELEVRCTALYMVDDDGNESGLYGRFVKDYQVIDAFWDVCEIPAGYVGVEPIEMLIEHFDDFVGADGKLDDEFEAVWNDDEKMELLLDYRENVNRTGTLSDAEEARACDIDDWEEYADELFYDCNGVDRDSKAAYYVDWGKWENDLSYDYTFGDKYVFINY